MVIYWIKVLSVTELILGLKSLFWVAYLDGVLPRPFSLIFVAYSSVILMAYSSWSYSAGFSHGTGEFSSTGPFQDHLLYLKQRLNGASFPIKLQYVRFSKYYFCDITFGWDKKLSVNLR